MKITAFGAALSAVAFLILSGCAKPPTAPPPPPPGAAEIAAMTKLASVIVDVRPDALDTKLRASPIETEGTVAKIASHLERDLTKTAEASLTGERPVNVIASILYINAPSSAAKVILGSDARALVNGTVSLVDVETGEVLTENNMSGETTSGLRPGELVGVISLAVNIAAAVAVDDHADMSAEFAKAFGAWLARPAPQEPAPEEPASADAATGEGTEGGTVPAPEVSAAPADS